MILMGIVQARSIDGMVYYWQDDQNWTKHKSQATRITIYKADEVIKAHKAGMTRLMFIATKGVEK
jgi:hypothetical protein